MRKILFNLIMISMPFLLAAQDLERFRDEVEEIKARDFSLDDTRPVILFTGSSSVRLWKNLDELGHLISTKQRFESKMPVEVRTKLYDGWTKAVNSVKTKLIDNQ